LGTTTYTYDGDGNKVSMTDAVEESAPVHLSFVRIAV
jgi:hypothetical protein